MATKQVVLEYLQHNRTLRDGRDLYNKFPQKNLAIQSFISRMANTERNLKVVCYELCKLVSISERQMNALLSQPISIKEVKPEVVLKKIISVEELLLNFDAAKENDFNQIKKLLSIEIEVPEFTKGLLGTKERKEFLKEKGIETSETTNKGLDSEINTYLQSKLVEEIEAKKAALISSKLKELPKEQKQSIKIREQFPFLKDKECPRVLHLIVADLITAYEVFKETQPLLHEKASEADLKNLCKEVVASYIDRKEAFVELEYYHQNQALLGKHPIFEKLAQEDVIKKMSAQELAKKISNLIGNINKNKKKLKNAETEEKKLFYKDLIASQESLKEVALKEQATR